MKNVLAILFILLISSIGNAQSLQEFADSLRETNQIPEIGYAVVTADTILELQTLGYHRIDVQNEDSKARNTDYFHLGSNTKAITGFIAAYLVEKNKIKWTTKFFDLFPSWKKESNSAYYDITLKDLLTHRARIQPYTSGLEYQELPEFKGTKSEQRKQFSKYLLKEKPVNLNGKSYAYSNAGYSIAALMLEKVTGLTWEKLIEEVIHKKLHLNYKFGWPNKNDANQPWGHWLQNDTLQALPPDIKYNLNLAEPAGDISMTLPDYAKFIQLNLQGLTGKGNLLKPETYNFLHYGLKDYSIGWSNVNKRDKQFSEHTGSAGTFYCYALIDKKKKIGYIVVANSGTEKAVQGVFKLLKRLRETYGG